MAKNETEQIIFRVQRYDPEGDSTPRMQEFVAPSSRGMTVLDGLIYIKENLDSTLAFRTSCRMAICGSCGMLVNNYPHLACHTQIEEFHSSKLTIKPLPNFAIIKDLTVDLAPLFDNHKFIEPFIIRKDTEEMGNPKREFCQSPEAMESYLGFSYCVKCGICVSSCPTSASDKCFLGPQALAQCYRYCADSRDGGESKRLSVVDEDHGAFNCHFAGACSDSCPKGVDPAFAINLLKGRLISTSMGGKMQSAAPLISPLSQTKPGVPFPEFTVK